MRAAELDAGTFTIYPNLDATPAISQAEATTLFHADSSVSGAHTGQLIGFGEVTVTSSLTAGAKEPALTREAAWVGFAYGGITSCPAITVSPSDTKEPTTTVTPAPTPGYTAVIIEGGGSPVIDYQSRGSLCGGPETGPSLSSAKEQLSVPWQAVSLTGSTLTFRYQAPSCLSDDSLQTAVSAGGTQPASLTVDIDVPYGPSGCPDSWRTDTFGWFPQPPASISAISHGTTGPADSLQTPPIGVPGPRVR